MRRIVVVAARADAFCSRLNDGLSAVAIALALLTLVAWVARAPQIFQTLDAEWPTIEEPY
ncbi:MAG TPA: hypothetical protein VJO12_15205 [Stellaceae bacterium]|nr:hypothetical protein [Stellaceae bacterium]